MHLKPIAEQVIVISGATSGIGLATARLAAKHGARLVLVARNEPALEQIMEELQASGAQVRSVVADVADEQRLRVAAQLAVDEFGGFDTWVNNAGVSVFGFNLQVTREDQRRVFETNFWGVVNGSTIAAEYLRNRSGGAIINLGSELSDAYAPLQGIYTASKHAVKAYTESLRAEFEYQRLPISVTLIKPAAMATLFVEHAKNYMDVEPKLPGPIYAPELVAEAILTAARQPRREIFVGGAAKLMSVTAKFAPSWVNRRIEQSMFTSQRSHKPERNPEQNSLHQPGSDLRVRGEHAEPVQEHCPYTRAALHPKQTYAMVGGALIGLAWLAKKTSRRDIPHSLH